MDISKEKAGENGGARIYITSLAVSFFMKLTA
jgi:hypothetical protein